MTVMSNIKLRKANMSIKDHYFYMFDDDADLLMQKVDDGVVAFSYPLDTPLANEVIDSEFDGINFWTLENTNPNAIIKRWVIENYICKLKTTLEFIGEVSTGHYYDVDAFSVENYYLTISGTQLPGDKIIYVSPGYSAKIMGGMTVTLGPNYSGHTETILVSTAVDGIVTLSTEITQTYQSGDDFRFYNNLFLFNNFDGIDDTSAALYKMNAYDGSFLVKYTGGAYKDVTASKFVNTDKFTEYGIINSLAFVKGANLLFINIEQLGTLSEIYRSMVIDNLLVDTGEILHVFDIDIVDDNIYKLQTNGCKFGENVVFESGANYMIEPFKSFLTSVLLYTNPGIIPANNIATTVLTAQAADQYGLPVSGKLIYFSCSAEEDDPVVYIDGPNYSNTDIDGKATIVLRAGPVTGLAKMIATVEQS